LADENVPLAQPWQLRSVLAVPAAETYSPGRQLFHAVQEVLLSVVVKPVVHAPQVRFALAVPAEVT